MYNIEDRTIRIFISSTFEDMKDERDYLIEKTFPHLQSIAAQRDVTLIALDLRWGINEEQSKTGQVLEICLNEIDQSHPFFIGLVGNRYGWVPTKEEIEKNPSLMRNYAWVEKEIETGLSITEIEFNRGALHRESEEEIHATFYVKNTPESDNCSAEQKRLRNKVRNNGKYPVSEYSSIEELDELVTRDILNLMDALYPKDYEEDFLTKERTMQNAFMRSRFWGYVPNIQHYASLDAFVKSEDSTFVVTGARGSGKSSLIANWINYRKDDLGANIIYFFIGNGSSEGDYKYIARYITEAVEEMYGKSEDSESISTNDSSEAYGSTDYDSKLRDCLASVYGKKKLIIALDAINQLNNANDSKLLNWLPLNAPNVQFILSTTPEDESYHRLSSMSAPEIFIEPLDTDTQKTIIHDYLSVFGKQDGLTAEQVDFVIRHKIAQSPLVLRTFLDELIIWGDYDRLSERLTYYFSSESVEVFFESVVHRYEEDFGYEFVMDCLSTIAFSRIGMKEQELIDILGLKHRDWSLFHSAFRWHMTSQQGLLSFSHGYLKEAVQNLYSKEEDSSRARIINYFEGQESNPRKHEEMAYQYHSRDNDAELYRSLLNYNCLRHHLDKQQQLLSRYWTYLLHKDKASYSLYVYIDLYKNEISDNALYMLYKSFMAFLGKVMDNYTLAVRYAEMALSYSTQKNRASLSSSLGAIYYHLEQYELSLKHYKEALASGFDPDILYINLVYLYSSLNKFATAHKYCEEASRYTADKFGAISKEMARCHRAKALLYSDQCIYDKAIESYNEALRIDLKFYGEQHRLVAIDYNDISSIYKELLQLDKALEHARKALEISIALYGEQHAKVASCYNRIGNIYLDQNKFEEALEYYERSLAIDIAIFGEKHARVADYYANISGVHKALHQFDKALEHARKALEISIALYGEQHAKVASCYNRIGNIYLDQNKFEEALEYYERSLAIDIAIFGEKHARVASYYANISGVHKELLQLDKALEHARKALEISIALYGEQHTKVASCYNCIGNIYFDQNKFEEALEYYERSLAIDIAIFGEKHARVASYYANISGVHKELLQLDKALEHARKALEISIALYGEQHAKVASCYNRIGNIYFDQNIFEEALEYYERTLAIDIAIFGEKHANVASYYANISGVHKALHQFDKALEHARKALEISITLYGEQHAKVASCYNRIGNIHFNQKKFEEALEYYERSLAIGIAIFGEKHARVASYYANISDVHKALHQFDKALEHARKALEIDIDFYGEQHAKVASCYNGIGNIYFDQNKFDEAREYYERSLAIDIAVFGEKNARIASYYGDIARVYEKQEQFDKAFKYLELALNISKEISDYHNMTLLYNKIGLVYYAENKYQQAIEYHMECLQYAHSTYGENHLDTALYCFNLGLSHFYLGNYQIAKEYNDSSMRTRKQLTGEETDDVVQNYYLGGMIFKELGQDTLALEIWKKAETILIGLGRNNSVLADILVEIGKIYYDPKSPVKNYYESIEYNKRALEIYHEIYGANNNNTANCYYYLGVAYRRYEYYDHAADCFEKEIQIIRILRGDNDKRVADRYKTLAELYYKRFDPGHDYEKAIYYYKKELEIRLSLAGENDLDVAACYHAIGRCYNRISEYEAALEYHEKGHQIKKDILGENNDETKRAYDAIKDVAESLVYKIAKSGDEFKENREYEKAIECYNRAIQTIQQYLDGTLSLFIYHFRLARLYAAAGNFQKALDCYDMHVDYVEKFNKSLVPYSLGCVYAAAGKTYYEKRKYHEAIYYDSEAIRLFEAENKETLEMSEYREYIDACNRLACYHYIKNDWTQTIQLFEKEIEIRKTSDLFITSDIFLCYYLIGCCYNCMKEHEKSMDTLSKAITIIKNEGEDNYDYAYLKWGQNLNAPKKIRIIRVKRSRRKRYRRHWFIDLLMKLQLRQST